jgi:hypothetical protein
VKWIVWQIGTATSYCKYSRDEFDEMVGLLYNDEIDSFGVLDMTEKVVLRFHFDRDDSFEMLLPTFDIDELKRLSFLQALQQAKTVTGAGRLMGVTTKTAFNLKNRYLDKNGKIE